MVNLVAQVISNHGVTANVEEVTWLTEPQWRSWKAGIDVDHEDAKIPAGRGRGSALLGRARLCRLARDRLQFIGSFNCGGHRQHVRGIAHISGIADPRGIAERSSLIGRGLIGRTERDRFAVPNQYLPGAEPGH